jgi:hypothetical protein
VRGSIPLRAQCMEFVQHDRGRKALILYNLQEFEEIGLGKARDLVILDLFLNKTERSSKDQHKHQ